jgi:aminoglycoside phosphotransferase (APT) family kinase protein
MAETVSNNVLDMLSKWVQNAGIAMDSPKKIQRIVGGFSNLTFLVIDEAEKRHVLRQPPPGAGHIKGGHDMVREYRILESLHAAGFDKVPRPIALCEDLEVLGVPFYIMEWIEGTVLRPLQQEVWQDWMAGQWQDISTSFCTQLVALHGIDIKATGLVAIGKPEGYIQRQVEGWSGRYEAAQTTLIEDMHVLAGWLHTHMPQEQPPAMLHNDFKYDNAILDTTHQPIAIKALLDWEMATVGDPRMDLGAAMAYWAEATDGPFERSFNTTWLPGNLTRREFVDLYAHKSGRDCSEILFFYVFGLYKNAVIMQQIYKRYEQGLTTDARFGGLLQGVKVMAHKGILSLERDAMC